ncbi:MAG: helix-turn-helix transcriptional regulator [Pirellulales bacterium]
MTKSLHTPAYRKITEALKQMRLEAGVSQRELAKRLGQQLNYISRLEQGQRRLDLLEWTWLCEALGRDPVREGRNVLEKLRSK